MVYAPETAVKVSDFAPVWVCVATIFALATAAPWESVTVPLKETRNSWANMAPAARPKKTITMFCIRCKHVMQFSFVFFWKGLTAVGRFSVLLTDASLGLVCHYRHTCALREPIEYIKNGNCRSLSADQAPCRDLVFDRLNHSLCEVTFAAQHAKPRSRNVPTREMEAITLANRNDYMANECLNQALFSALFSAHYCPAITRIDSIG